MTGLRWALGLALLCAAPLQAKTVADSVYLNGRIYTLDAQSSMVSAVALRDGRFIAVGTDKEGKALIGPQTQVVDLKGATVVPGLIDSHIHLVDARAGGDLQARYAQAQQVANSFGLTSVVAATSGANDVRALQALKRDGKLTLRFSVILPPPATTTPTDWTAIEGSGVASDFGDEWLRLDSLGEMPVDGGMTYGTALTREPYPRDPAYHGTAAMSPEELNARVAIGNRLGWRYTLHAVGDAGIDRLLDAYEAAGQDRPIAGRRFVVLRGNLAQRDQLERMKRLGLILQMENLFMWDKTEAVERNLGSAMANRVIPNRLAIDVLGIDRVSAGSDFPTNSMNPWLNMAVAITRKDQNGKLYGADQAIGREEALRSYTSSGAYASFEEGLKGSIEVGKLADLVILDRDFMRVPVEQIKDVQAVTTIVGGKTVFSR